MPVFRGDPCGITCLILTYAAIFYADYVIVNWVVLQTMSTRYCFLLSDCIRPKTGDYLPVSSQLSLMFDVRDFVMMQRKEGFCRLASLLLTHFVPDVD